MFRAINEWWKGPWRKPSKDKWNKKLSTDLKEEVKNIKFAKGVRKAGILFCGPAKSGKSSLINTIFSIGEGRPAYVSPAMNSSESITMKFIKQPEDSYFKNFGVRDTLGFAEHKGLGFNVGDLEYALNGNIKEGYQFKSDEPIQPDDKYFENSPSEEDKSHCLVVVLDVMLLDSVTDKMSFKFKQAVKETIAKGIPIVLILTKIDNLYPYLKKDITYLFHSNLVKEAVRKAERLLGFQSKNIHPVANFVDETDVDPIKGIPVLLALKQILYYASDGIKMQA